MNGTGFAQVINLADPGLLKKACYVNGEWVMASSKKTFEVTDPATGEVITNCPEFDAQDADVAIRAAAAALPCFRKLAGRERSRMLRRWYDLMMENLDDLAKIITWENGKPIADSKAEIAYAAGFFEWFSEEAPRIHGDTIQATSATNRVVTVKEPVGVCALIAPWNFPAAMITRKVGPALAAGCTVVVKAPAEAPLTCLAIAELAHRAGIPKGVVNCITALNNTVEIGEILCTSRMIKKLSFTGSTAVGKLLMRNCSSTLKKLSFELGGNAPFIVFDDANLDLAIKGLVASKFRISGQTCVCANRIFVQRRVYGEMVQRTIDVIKTFSVGNGFKDSTTHGPLIHERAVSKVAAHVADAVSKGAKIEHGGKKSSLGACFYPMTVLTGMTKDMVLTNEETFGPLAAFYVFDTEEEVIEMANDSDVGLAGYFYSENISRCWRVAEALEVGMVGCNTGTISDPHVPFGGVKQSGFGREGSRYGIDEYLVTKMIMTGGIER